MKKTTFLSLSALTAFAIPMVASAQNFFYVQNWFSAIRSFASQAVTIAMIGLTLWFIFAVFRYIAAKDPKEIQERRHAMGQALIGLFVAVSVWGIIRLAGSVLGTSNTGDYVNCLPGTTNVNGRCI